MHSFHQVSSRRHGRPFRSGGFTLIEVLLSLMLISMILVATTFFIFSMGELWGRGSDTRLFDRHARGVTRFVQHTINQSAVHWDAENSQRVSLTQPPGVGHFDDPLITFEVAEGPPFLVWPDVALPAVVLYLRLVPGEGLFLLWHSRLEVDFEDQPPRATLLSPFVTEMIFDYYDPETRVWSSLGQLDSDIQGEPLLPSRIRLVFSHDRMEKETVLVLPRRNATVALF
jgi:prepilin-type N-terminal cleavage/methylation domain-containing protein